jgi:hypothetical protein
VFSRTSGVLLAPSWGIVLTDVGLRLEKTAAGRARQDVFFAATLPIAGDFAGELSPTAIGAATRYLPAADGDAPPLSLVAMPILVGPPPPGSATAVGYRGGVLVFYSARSGPRTAIGVGRHP